MRCGARSISLLGPGLLPPLPAGSGVSSTLSLFPREDPLPSAPRLPSAVAAPCSGLRRRRRLLVCQHRSPSYRSSSSSWSWEAEDNLEVVPEGKTFRCQLTFPWGPGRKWLLRVLVFSRSEGSSQVLVPGQMMFVRILSVEAGFRCVSAGDARPAGGGRSGCIVAASNGLPSRACRLHQMDPSAASTLLLPAGVV